MSDIIVDFIVEIDHFDGGESGVGAFVSDFDAGAIDGLIDGIGGDDAISDGDLRL